MLHGPREIARGRISTGDLYEKSFRGLEVKFPEVDPGRQVRTSAGDDVSLEPEVRQVSGDPVGREVDDCTVAGAAWVEPLQDEDLGVSPEHPEVGRLAAEVDDAVHEQGDDALAHVREPREGVQDLGRVVHVSGCVVRMRRHPRGAATAREVGVHCVAPLHQTQLASAVGLERTGKNVA